jgi:hypothetical protein
MEYEDESGFANGVAIFVIASFAILFFVGAILALWDLNRFGRKHAPWWVALAYAALFSAFGFWQFKLPGTLPGLLCVWAFQLGRIQANRSANQFSH